MDIVIPPVAMRVATIENDDPDLYLITGVKLATDFAMLAHKYKLSISGTKSILDFGCGVGRVARAWAPLTSAKIHAVDVVRPFIEWCAENIDNVSFFSGEQLPPLPYSENQFDIVYAVSVFTHLDERYQDAWLSELKRITAPGGLLFCSFRSDKWLQKRARKTFNNLLESGCFENGICFVKTDRHREYFEDFYQGAYHTEHYIYDHWGRYFEILELIEGGKMTIVQDLAVMKNSLD